MTPADAVELRRVQVVEAVADAEHEGAEHAERHEHQHGGGQLDHERHPGRADRGQDQPVLQRQEPDDLQQRVAPGAHHQQAEQHDRERQRQRLAGGDVGRERGGQHHEDRQHHQPDAERQAGQHRQRGLGGDGGQDNDGKPGTGGKDGGADGGQDGDTTDWKAEAEKWKTQSRKHEERAKTNAQAAKDLAELKRQGMSDTEKAVDEAAAAARTEERQRLGGKLARSAFIAAAAGRLPDAAAVADDLNLTKYVTEDGEVDEKGLAELVDRLAPKNGTGTGAGGQQRGFDQGAGRGAQGKASSVSAGRDLWAERNKKTTT